MSTDSKRRGLKCRVSRYVLRPTFYLCVVPGALGLLVFMPTFAVRTIALFVIPREPSPTRDRPQVFHDKGTRYVSAGGFGFLTLCEKVMLIGGVPMGVCGAGAAAMEALRNRWERPPGQPSLVSSAGG